MKVYIADNYEKLSAIAADIIQESLALDPHGRLGLATGSTPLGLYGELIRRCKSGLLDFSRASAINLDEYVGLGPDHPQSYRYFMDKNLFDHINIDKANTYVAKGEGDTDRNLEEFRRTIAQKTTAVQVLGVGVDGHIGFNEPGEALWGGAHIENLDESTIAANARFFESPLLVPRRALTMGIADIMHAKKLLLLAGGRAKAGAMRELLMGEKITPRDPVTMTRLHGDLTVIIDRELADSIGYAE